MKSQYDVRALVQDLFEDMCNEQPDHFLIVHKGVEKTVTEWCEYFGGVPDGVSNHNFLMEMLNEKV